MLSGHRVQCRIRCCCSATSTASPAMNVVPAARRRSFDDAWHDAGGGAAGFTCCQAGDLMNPESTAGRPHRPGALPGPLSRQRHDGHGDAIPPPAARPAGCGHPTTSACSPTSSWSPEPACPTGQTPHRRVQSDVGEFTILLVEDDFDVREALAETLRDEGYAVECAVDGEQALDYLRGGGRPGLILLDLMMPRMSGSEFRMVQKVDPQLRRPAGRAAERRRRDGGEGARARDRRRDPEADRSRRAAVDGRALQ